MPSAFVCACSFYMMTRAGCTLQVLLPGAFLPNTEVFLSKALIHEFATESQISTSQSTSLSCV